MHGSSSTPPPCAVLADRGSRDCSPGTPEHRDTPQGPCWGLPALTPGGCWGPCCAQSLWALTLGLGMGFLIQPKQGLMSSVSVFDCKIPFLKLHPLFSGLGCTRETCVGCFYVDEGNDSAIRKGYRKGPCFSVGLVETSTIFPGSSQWVFL